MKDSVDPLGPHATDLKGTLSIGLQEALAALDRAVDGLTDEQFVACPLPTEDCIARIAMQILQDLDAHAVVSQGGHASFAHEERWRPGPKGAYLSPECGEPDLAQFRQWVVRVRQNAENLLELADEGALRSQRDSSQAWPGSSAGAYLTTIFHALSQVHRIWLLRGLLGALPAEHRQDGAASEEEGTDSARAVAELHYESVLKGNKALWRMTLIPAYQTQQRVPGSAPERWWSAARRMVDRRGATYRYLGEDTQFRTERNRRLLFERVRRGGSAHDQPVSIHLVLTQAGWRVKTVSY